MIRLVSCITLTFVLAGCEATVGGASASSPGGDSDTVELWRARCGSCHTIVQPGTRARATLITALQRHRTRVHLRESQWSALIDYLAPAASSSPAAP